MPTLTSDADFSDILKRLRDLEASQQVANTQMTEVHKSLQRIEEMLSSREVKFDGIIAQLYDLRMAQSKQCSDAELRAQHLEADFDVLRKDFDSFVAIVRNLGVPMLLAAIFSIGGLIWSLVTHRITLTP